ncbi:MAG: hypothetical protein KAT77_05560, partial [Nanoarchaeota archaeon]|nr:hypothetical protein [Nanoarchaeota archaeon]
PDILQYPNDILELAKKGATSFHTSEERWLNPLQLNPDLKKRELDNLRIGWDLVLDIDCKFIEYSKIAAHLIIKFLDYNKIKSYSIKFSVTGDTPLLIKTDKTISLVPIAKVIELHKSGKKIQVLSLNKRRKVCFSKVYDYLTHKEKIYEIHHAHSTIPIKATKHHSVFVWNRGFIIQKKVNELKDSDELITFNSSNNLTKEPEYFSWEFDYNKKPTKREIKINRDLMRLLGYYLAEGHITKTIYQIGFSFHIDEKDYISDCVNLLKRFTKRFISIRHPNPKTTQILIHSKEWYHFFEKSCGKGAKNKHVPEFSWELPKEYFEEMLKSYIRGDGYKRGQYSITIKSVSHQLITQLVWLSKLNGISCSVNQEFCREHELPQGNIFKGSHVYTMNIPKSELNSNEFFRERNKFSPHPHDKVFPVDGLRQVYHQIKPKKFNHHRTEQMSLKKKSANLKRIKKILDWFDKTKSIDYDYQSKKIISNYKKLFNNDIATVKIKKMVKSKKENVYDVSVSDTEAFFGGVYPVLLHNSGNKGFHIAVPFEAFPEKINNQEIKDLFPEAPRRIAFYITEKIKNPLSRQILKLENSDFNKIKEKTGLETKNIIRYQRNEFGEQIPALDVEPFLEIDTLLISSRHLYRAPYSLHEKSGLVSIPINPKKILEFTKNQAKPGCPVSEFVFLDKKAQPNEAKSLLVQAFDFKMPEEEIQIQRREMPLPENAIPENCFPPCIHRILKGLEDGKKRSTFILINFLKKCGWGHEEIKSFLLDWNKRNQPESLRENILLGQLNSAKNKKPILPPNCSHPDYYKSFNVCHPEPLCKKIKNPVNFALIKSRFKKE